MPTMPIDCLLQPSNFSISSGSSPPTVEKTGGEADVGKYLPEFKVGQWWAQKKPTCLFRVRDAPEHVYGSGDGITFDAWFPSRHQELICYYDGPNIPLVYLWFKREMHFPTVGDPAWAVGAAYVALRNERIFFIGPRVGNGFTVHASWDVYDADLCNCVLFQLGALVEPPPQTAFEQLNTDIDR